MPLEARIQRLSNVAKNRQEGVIVLENIYDPHNAQAVVRTAEFFGFQTIYLIFEEGRGFNPRKVGKHSSSHARKWVDYEEFDSTQACFDKLKQEGYDIIATMLDENAEDIFESKIQQKNKKIALLFGNEKEGVSELAAKLADRKLYIPQRGMVQSLNLSVTAAMCLYELTRERQELGMDEFLLDEASGEALAKDFVGRSHPHTISTSED